MYMLLQMTNDGTEMLEVDTYLEVKNQQLFRVCFHFHLYAHMIPSNVRGNDTYYLIA